ncbi:MAG: hypothetical protein EOS81_02890 [Mesorhizobium sp.]|nr:MAG: hypothetical protein EOS81_02890 [Mesorhizobium sp.]TIV58690.1 MAG: hypothetical protein E5V80_17300 [Mesorhizobium sp.]
MLSTLAARLTLKRFETQAHLVDGVVEFDDAALDMCRILDDALGRLHQPPKLGLPLDHRQRSQILSVQLHHVEGYISSTFQLHA